jgi:hypothetical protein
VNLKQLTVALSLLASGAAAMAVEATQWNPPAGQLSRAQVKTELARAVADGELESRGEAYAGYVDRHAPKSTLARAEVKHDLELARASGELDNRNEAYGGFQDARPRVTDSRFASRKARQAAKRDAE